MMKKTKDTTNDVSEGVRQKTTARATTRSTKIKGTAETATAPAAVSAHPRLHDHDARGKTNEAGDMINPATTALTTTMLLDEQEQLVAPSGPVAAMKLRRATAKLVRDTAPRKGKTTNVDAHPDVDVHLDTSEATNNSLIKTSSSVGDNRKKSKKPRVAKATKSRKAKVKVDPMKMNRPPSHYRLQYNAHDKKRQFPFKMWDLLADAQVLGFDDIVEWTDGGKAFTVHKNKPFASKILPQYFGTQVLRSFARQLSFWGFIKTSDPKYQLTGEGGCKWHHPKFHAKATVRDLDMIERKVPKQAKAISSNKRSKSKIPLNEGDTEEDEDDEGSNVPYNLVRQLKRSKVSTIKKDSRRPSPPPVRRGTKKHTPRRVGAHNPKEQVNARNTDDTSEDEDEVEILDHDPRTDSLMYRMGSSRELYKPVRQELKVAKLKRVSGRFNPLDSSEDIALAPLLQRGDSLFGDSISSTMTAATLRQWHQNAHPPEMTERGLKVDDNDDDKSQDSDVQVPLGPLLKRGDSIFATDSPSMTATTLHLLKEGFNDGTAAVIVKRAIGGVDLGLNSTKDMESTQGISMATTDNSTECFGGRQFHEVTELTGLTELDGESNGTSARWAKGRSNTTRTGASLYTTANHETSAKLGAHSTRIVKEPYRPRRVSAADSAVATSDSATTTAITKVPHMSILPRSSFVRKYLVATQVMPGVTLNDDDVMDEDMTDLLMHLNEEPDTPMPDVHRGFQPAYTDVHPNVFTAKQAASLADQGRYIANGASNTSQTDMSANDLLRNFSDDEE